jgi:N-acetylmuramoyl-L-alanine amidase
MRIRRLTSGATTVELRGRDALMAWVHEEVEPRRLTIRVPRSSLACAAPRARGAVERVTLRREPEAWALGLDLAEGRYVLDSAPTQDGKGLILRIEKAPALDAARPLVLVDAGHGGYDPGALGPTGKTESQVALGVARQLARLLAGAGFQAVLIRTADAELRLPDRETLIGRHDAVALVSLHCNSSDAPDAIGIETYFRHESGHGLARAIQEQLVATTGRPDRGVRTARLFVLRGERTPAALVEMGFISSPAEERRLVDPDYQKVLAQAIATGIKKFFEERKVVVGASLIGGWCGRASL